MKHYLIPQGHRSPFPRFFCQVTPIIKGIEGCSEEAPLVLPEELSWAKGDAAISTAVFFLSSEAELMAKTFVPRVLILYMKSWISNWDGGKAPLGPLKHWLTPAVRQACMNNAHVGLERI